MPPTAAKYVVEDKKSKTDRKKKQKVVKKAVVSGQLEKKITNKKLLRKKSKKRHQFGLVFIKNLPHGFYEEQIRSYFEQFGTVTRVRVARSRKTGSCRNFAYVQFSIPEVAKIAAETMNNYLMFHKLVKATYISPYEQKYNYFRTSVRRIKTRMGGTTHQSAMILRRNRQANKMNEWTETSAKKRFARTEKKVKHLNEKYASVGLNVEDLVLRPKTSSSSG